VSDENTPSLRERLADILEDFRGHQNGDRAVEEILAEVRNLDLAHPIPSSDEWRGCFTADCPYVVDDIGPHQHIKWDDGVVITRLERP
jgi:hypothetical protein